MVHSEGRHHHAAVLSYSPMWHRGSAQFATEQHRLFCHLLLLGTRCPEGTLGAVVVAAGMVDTAAVAMAKLMVVARVQSEWVVADAAVASVAAAEDLDVAMQAEEEGALAVHRGGEHGRWLSV